MNSPDQAASLMYEILREKDVVDRVSSRLCDGHRVFLDVSLDMPKLAPAELGLLRTVSYFYVLYFEVGKVDIDFLKARFSVYQLDHHGQLQQHPILINKLRTYFQHNLNPSSPRDRGIQGHCEAWFKQQCGTSEPYGEDHWHHCLLGFLQEAHLFFKTLSSCIREIEQDESREQIVQQWEIRRSRYHPPHQFDGLISKVAADMGREALDSVVLRKRFYDKWTQELQMLRGDYDFEIEARKLIEHALLHETKRVLPVTGRDILSEFENIEPGPKVAELLDLASQLYVAEPCSREELLVRLRHSLELQDEA